MDTAVRQVLRVGQIRKECVIAGKPVIGSGASGTGLVLHLSRLPSSSLPLLLGTSLFSACCRHLRPLKHTPPSERRENSLFSTIEQKVLGFTVTGSSDCREPVSINVARRTPFKSLKRRVGPWTQSSLPVSVNKVC